MKENKKKKRKYVALSLVELIISIGVAGIALLVLMSIAANNMREAIRYERHDALTRLAMDGALAVRKHVEEANDRRERENRRTFEPEIGVCYRIDREEEVGVDFTQSYRRDSISTEEELEVKVIYDSKDLTRELGDVLYMAYCPTDSVQSALNNIYVGDILTGYIECRNCGIEEYSYNIVVSVRIDVED
jgi:hypothetical protein